MSRVAPFLVPDPDAVRPEPWHRLINSGTEPLPEILDGWDYATDLTLVRRIHIDIDRVYSSAELPAEARLGIVVTWQAAGSNLSGATAVHLVDDDVIDVVAELSGGDLGARVQLATRLVLAAPVEHAGPGTASAAGSILYEDSYGVTLLGDLAQFPIAVVDFAAAGLDQDASIVVEIDADPDTPVLAGVLLLLNSRDQQLVRAASSPGADPLDQLLASQIGEHVTRELLTYATRHSEQLATVDWEPGSIGAVCVALAGQVERVHSVVDLAGMELERPTLFQSVVVGEARRNGIGRQLG